MNSVHRPRLLAVLSVCIAAIIASAGVLRAQTAQSPYVDMYDAITHMSIDPTEVYTISNAVLQRDAGELSFQSGTIALTAPIQGSVRAIVFRGTGNFSFSPPTNVEQEQLQRYYKTRALSTSVTGVVMFVADSTLDELRFDMKKTESGNIPLLATLLNDAVGYIHYSDEQYVQPQIIRSFLENKANGMFYAHIESDDGPLFFSVDPYEEEEISLLRFAKGTRVGTYALETISQFHTMAEYTAGPDPLEDKAVVAVDKYTMDVSFSSNADMQTKAEVQFTGLADGVRWVPFGLYPELDIASMTWGNGAPAVYFKGEKNGFLWVRLEQPMKKGEKYTVKMNYGGAAMNRYGDWLVLWSSTGWYPIHSSLQKAIFDVTYHFPERYELAGVGEKVSEDENDDETKTSRWVTKYPIRNCCFNIGKFDKFDISDERTPPTTLYVSDDIPRSRREEVKIDIITSLAFFQQLYGKLPIEHFHATPIPLAHGEAFPGLIHLSASTFESTEASGFDEMFRAHEVAHQWWGIGLDFRSYHDQWLSEAFAHYSGLMYMQLIRKDNDLFFNQLEKWRDQIVDNRKTIFGANVQAGPIWLGGRTNTSSTGGDYNLIIYEKGAWVLHMLRNMLIDIKTMKEDRFFAMMKDFYTTYQGKRATTDDFHGIVEKHIGMDMDWFFNQWVYGTAVPKYTYAYKTEKTPEGKYQVTIRVKQENVPDGFQMPVPVLVDFGDDKYVRLRVMVSKSQEDILLPLLPMEPEKIVFNIYNSVLCETDEDSWE